MGEKPEKNLFQEQSARSKHSFDIDFEWVEEDFSTREPQFNKRLFQRNIQGQSVTKYPTFPVPIVNAKETGEIEYGLKDPQVKYHIND